MIFNKLHYFILGLFGIIISISILFLANQSVYLIKYNWMQLLVFSIVLVLILFSLDLVYEKSRQNSHIDMTTISQRPDMNLFQAKLVLKEKNEFLIQEFDRIFGREDFVGLVGSDDLMFIGKEHFKIIKKDDGFYIEDLNTKNGTSINGIDIKGKGQKKLKNEDHILVAKTIEIRYVELGTKGVK